MRTIVILPFLFTICCFTATSQVITQNQKNQLDTREYYIAAINDQRPDKTPSALNGISSSGISQLIMQYVPSRLSLRPVVITLKEFKVTETPGTDQLVSGRIELNFSYGLQKDYGIEALSAFHASATYQRRGPQNTVNTPVTGILHSGLQAIADWLKANADTNRKLARGVHVSFHDYHEETEGDTIYYNAKRPLTWADFQSKRAASARYEALVMPGIGYIYKAKMQKGIIEVTVDMKPYLPKSASWASSFGRDAYSLNHEQRHFDIVKVISEQFKEKVLANRLTPDNFEAILNMQYLDSYRDMDAMQSAYDKETAHGTNKSAQSVWNDRIDQYLKRFSAYP